MGIEDQILPPEIAIPKMFPYEGDPVLRTIRNDLLREIMFKVTCQSLIFGESKFNTGEWGVFDFEGIVAGIE